MAKDDREISTAAKELKEYSTKANTLLQRQAKARDAYDAAKLAADEADQQLTLLETLGHRTTSGGSSAGDLSYLTDERIRQGDLVRKATASTADLKAKKDRAKADAAAAKKRLDSLQEKHAEELEESGPVMNALLGRTDESAQEASERSRMLSRTSARTSRTSSAPRPARRTPGPTPTARSSRAVSARSSVPRESRCYPTRRPPSTA